MSVPEDNGLDTKRELVALGHAVLSLPDGWWKYESGQRCNACGERYANLEQDADGPWGRIREAPIAGFTHRDGCPVPAIEVFRARHGEGGQG